MGTALHCGQRYIVIIFRVIRIILDKNIKNPARPITHEFMGELLSSSPTRNIKITPTTSVGMFILIDEIKFFLRAWNTATVFSFNVFILYSHNHLVIGINSEK